ncbi:MAG: phytanoyl-CoA dioxygenase, partial [Pseudomonadota bacterium]
MKVPFIKVPIVDYGDDEAAMIRYREEGTQRAMELGNRGPIRLDENGKVSQDILDAYSRCGFYVFEGVLKQDELNDIEQDLIDILDRIPAEKGAKVDKHGRPALGIDCKARNLSWVKPLTDPIGGTDAAHGRHPAKMNEPTPPDGIPEHIMQVMLGSLQFSDACLRVYGHPGLLKVAEAVHGEDFTPFNEALWIKHPGLGGAVAWHQDGWTHWNSPDF